MRERQDGRREPVSRAWETRYPALLIAEIRILQIREMGINAALP
jgi:hypothetical protein